MIPSAPNTTDLIKRRWNLRAKDVDPEADPPIDQLILWSCSDLKLEEAGCKELGLLYLWVDKILDQLKDIEACALKAAECGTLAPDPQAPAEVSTGLVVPPGLSVRPRRGSSPVRRIGEPAYNTLVTEHVGKRPRFPGNTSKPLGSSSISPTRVSNEDSDATPQKAPQAVDSSVTARKRKVLGKGKTKVFAVESDSSTTDDDDFDPFEPDNQFSAQEGQEDGSQSESDYVFVNETRVRKYKMKKKKKEKAASEAASLKKRKEMTTPRSGKRKAKGTPSTITPSKRARPLKQSSSLAVSPYTPTPNAASSGQATASVASTPGNLDEDDDDDDDENLILDRRKKQRSKVWNHFTLNSKHGEGYGLFRCHECGEEDVSARLNSTSNLLSHARHRCPKVLAMIEGTTRETYQATLGGLNVIIPPFTKSRLHDKLVEWIAVSGLPFTTVESGHLRELCKFLNHDATIPSADTIGRKLEVAYEDTESQVHARLKGVTSVVHYAHGAWTDPAHRNCFFGIYASYIHDHFVYREVLLRLMHLRGRGITDNAGNNLTTAEPLGERMISELLRDMPPTNLMRCICHITNLAAIDYLKAEAKLKRTDYSFNPAAIPEFRVLGQDDLHSNNELEEIAELEAIGAEEKEAAAKDGDARPGSADQKA
ncbi:hypothetical protein QFC20_007161 [Naganishia adeliensis]|uniref:Uncharacterized protein n=1 Tax=Naganishia adeliensis TaxID=92952 RepID=A0ACC2V1S9_9TREE|nr:hypothetical protein QFC20_007161 [Naganishia adeliensis]